MDEQKEQTDIQITESDDKAYKEMEDLYEACVTLGFSNFIHGFFFCIDWIALFVLNFGACCSFGFSKIRIIMFVFISINLSKTLADCIWRGITLKKKFGTSVFELTGILNKIIKEKVSLFKQYKFMCAGAFTTAFFIYNLYSIIIEKANSICLISGVFAAYLLQKSGTKLAESILQSEKVSAKFSDK